MDVDAALTAVRRTSTILEGLRAAERLEDVARVADERSAGVLVDGTGDADPITAIAAVRALGAQGGQEAGQHLVALLDDGRAHVAEHAVEALGRVAPQGAGLAPLARFCADGGFVGMLAQRTLEVWAATDPDAVHDALATALTGEDEPARCARLVETVGLVPGVAATRLLAQVGRDGGEPAVARAAERALTDRLTVLPVPAHHDGLTVVQLFLHGEVDAQLRHSGMGDTGGIATLLVQLGDALLRQGSHVSRVITVSGGREETSETLPGALSGPGHHYARIPLWGPPTVVATAWPHWVEARRGIRRVLRAAGRVDVVHLRMADVGSLVAAEVAAELGIPVVLTMAPDPQALVAAREQNGSLTRSGFGVADQLEHLWFRDRLLRRLARQAEHLVLFPRPDVERTISRLVGIDVAARPGRVDVIGEGIDLVALDRVAKEVAGDAQHSPGTTAALDELDDLLEQLPPGRRSLPLALSVGRLAPVKGMATLVSTWLEDPTLRSRCNLVLVGGDLEDPSREEAAELARIRDAVAADPAAGAGLLLAGHRPNATTTTWLAAAHEGRPGTAAPGGAYVCASLKEEFGIAILEAMAMGLVVVAPDSGGPATYVEDGVTGVLTNTADPQALAAAVGRALDLAASPGDPLRRRRSRAVVRDRFGIDTMAASLVTVYSGVAARHAGASRPMAATP